MNLKKIKIAKRDILEMQYIPSLDEDPKKRPKQKGLLPEEIKPIYALSLTDYNKLNSATGITNI